MDLGLKFSSVREEPLGPRSPGAPRILGWGRVFLNPKWLPGAPVTE